MEGGAVNPPPSNDYSRFTEAFEDAFPYYLAIGMPSDEYWNGRGDLVIGYREAHERKIDHENTMLWYQGLYVYCAVGALAPALGMGGGKVKDYVKKPFPITKAAIEQDKIDQMNQMAALAMAWAAHFKPEGEDGGSS